MRLALALVAVLAVAAGCSSRGGATAPPVRAPDAPAVESAVQQLYESGRYAEVVGAVAGARADEAGAEAVWFAAHSRLRLGDRDEAAKLFVQLNTSEADPAWRVTSQLALAGLDGSAEAAARAQEAAGGFPNHPFAQYELGLARARADEFAAAAQAFDRCIEASPRFAYAHYYAGLAYDRLGRADLMAIRFETFLRLAPGAPERPEVESILRTLRGR